MSTPLGDFLRIRRDATRPDQVGLPGGTRRRAPGLRRSELAVLAGISVEYLTRIEQGRDRSPSPSVLNALSEGLHLDVAEREHLRRLAKISAGTCGGPDSHPRRDVRPALLRVLEQLEPGLAMVTNRLGDILAHTSGFELIAGPSGLLDEVPANLTWFVFTDPRAREVFPEWDQLADERAFDLWLGPSAYGVREFSAMLAPVAGPEFTRRVGRHSLPDRGTLRWRHPAAGELRLDRETLELPATDAQQLVVFLPADARTASELDRLRSQGSRTLRAVR